jgi:TRAP-type C4-dicarboxylate transport system substrate-binding protein
VAKVVTLTGHFAAVRGFQINEKVFQSFPPEYQKILIEELVTAGAKRTGMQENLTKDYIQKMTEQGVSFVNPEIHLYREKTAPFFTEETKKWTQGDYEKLRKALEGK